MTGFPFFDDDPGAYDSAGWDRVQIARWQAAMHRARRRARAQRAVMLTVAALLIAANVALWMALL